MECGSVGVLRQVRIAPAERVEGAHQAHQNRPRASAFAQVPVVERASLPLSSSVPPVERCLACEADIEGVPGSGGVATEDKSRGRLRAGDSTKRGDTSGKLSSSSSFRLRQRPCGTSAKSGARF